LKNKLDIANKKIEDLVQKNTSFEAISQVSSVNNISQFSNPFSETIGEG
jgi:hypothetical protein